MRKFKYVLLIATMLFATTATAVNAAGPKGSGASVDRSAPAGVPGPASSYAGYCTSGGVAIAYSTDYAFVRCNWSYVYGAYQLSNGTYIYITYWQYYYDERICGLSFWEWTWTSATTGYYHGPYWYSYGNCGF